MKKIVYLTLLSTIALVLLSCATTKPQPLPGELLALHPEVDCPHEPRAGGWKIKAQLHQIDKTCFIVVYFNPGFNMIREPNLSVTTGFPVFLRRVDHRYFYRIGTLPKGRQVGTISFRTPRRQRSGREMVDQIETLRMERRKDSNCLKIIAQ